MTKVIIAPGRIETDTAGPKAHQIRVIDVGCTLPNSLGQIKLEKRGDS
jgi:hypothetical protein